MDILFIVSKSDHQQYPIKKSIPFQAVIAIITNTLFIVFLMTP